MPLRANAARFVTIALLLVCCALVLCPGAAGTPQGKPKAGDDRSKPKPELQSNSPQMPARRSRGYTIGVNVDLVVMHTAVHDKNGHFVGGLKSDSFKVYEDGIEQSISAFSQEDVPVSLGILMDLSGSMRNKIEEVTKSALAFITASNSEDQVFLIGFNDEVELIQDFTSDIDEITDSLENTIISGGTALYDAIYLGVQKAQSGTLPKKAIVVISDGEDRDSYYKLDELIAKVQESDVQIYCIGFLNEVPEKGLFGRWSKSVPEKAHDALDKIADETGGKAFFPKKVAEMNGIVAEIAHELRNQYSIGYISSNTARDGAFRRVKITLEASGSPRYYVRYRRGYFAPRDTSQ